ncbi:MAG: Crp/Fnr family transcriptional regulator [Hyphomonadaceae bacterium]
MAGSAQTQAKLRGAEAALAKSALFAALSAARREKLAGEGAVVQLQPGAQLFAKGAPGDALYVVLEGEIEVSVATEGGRSVRMAALAPGALIGEMAVLDGGVRSADATAVRRTRLLRIARQAALDALTAEPAALLAIVAEMSRRLREADGALEDAALLDLGGRLARLLLSEAGDGEIVALAQTELARRIGASREKVNRKLQQWKGEGWVSLGRAGVRLVSKERLEGLIAARREG